MATIRIETTAEEQCTVLDAVKTHEGKTVAVSKIAETAKLNQNRVRFVLEDLIELGKIRRTPTKAFNPRYIRYSYEVIK